MWYAKGETEMKRLIAWFIFMFFTIGMLVGNEDIDIRQNMREEIANYELQDDVIPYFSVFIKLCLLASAEVASVGQQFGRLLVPFHVAIGTILLLLVMGGEYIAYAIIITYLIIKERHTFLTKKSP